MVKDRYLDFLKKHNIPIPKDFIYESFFDDNMEINNLKNWEYWYNQIMEQEEELRKRYPQYNDKIITSMQKGEWDPELLANEIKLFSDFGNFLYREGEFWEKSFYWILGLSEKKLDLSPKHLFRIEVLKRDKWTCRKCGNHCNSTHHILSRKYCQENAPELEWDTRNGVALCFECHKAITEDGKKWFEENEK